VTSSFFEKKSISLDVLNVVRFNTGAVERGDKPCFFCSDVALAFLHFGDDASFFVAFLVGCIFLILKLVDGGQRPQ